MADLGQILYGFVNVLQILNMIWLQSCYLCHKNCIVSTRGVNGRVMIWQGEGGCVVFIRWTKMF